MSSLSPALSWLRKSPSRMVMSLSLAQRSKMFETVSLLCRSAYRREWFFEYPARTNSLSVQRTQQSWFISVEAPSSFSLRLFTWRISGLITPFLNFSSFIFGGFYVFYFFSGFSFFSLLYFPFALLALTFVESSLSDSACDLDSDSDYSDCSDLGAVNFFGLPRLPVLIGDSFCFFWRGDSLCFFWRGLLVCTRGEGFWRVDPLFNGVSPFCASKECDRDRDFPLASSYLDTLPSTDSLLSAFVSFYLLFSFFILNIIVLFHLNYLCILKSLT